MSHGALQIELDCQIPAAEMAAKRDLIANASYIEKATINGRLDGVHVCGACHSSHCLYCLLDPVSIAPFLPPNVQIDTVVLNWTLGKICVDMIGPNTAALLYGSADRRVRVLRVLESVTTHAEILRLAAIVAPWV